MKTSKNIRDAFNKIIKNKYLPFLLIAALGIVITIPLFTMNLSQFNEYRIHIHRITGVKEILKAGLFPPFLSNKYMLDFGYAINIFYGSLTTYIPILISLVTNTDAMALKIFTLITVILSGITMYVFTYKVTNKKTAGLVSALIYMAAPYKFTDIYSRNAVGEYTAFIFIPMIFHGIYELLNEDKKGNLWLITGASLLILSHTITTIYTAIFAIIFLAFNFKKLKRWELWKNLIIDVIFILMLTSFYTIPLIEHKAHGDYVIFDANKMNATGADAYEKTNSPLEWFKNELSYTTETSYQELIFSFGLAMTFLMFITVFCLKRINERYKEIYTTFWMLAIISLFLCTKAFPWFIMPHFISIIQFAWRLNGFFIFFISLVCGINAYEFSEILSRIKYTVVVLIVSVIFIMGALGVSKYMSKFDKEYDKHYERTILDAEIIGPYNINRDYMPLRAYNNLDYLQSRENRTYIINGEAKIVNEDKDKLNDTIAIENVNNASLELPYLYYQGYTITLNGNKLKCHESKMGFLCIDVSENGTIEVKYTGTIIEKMGFVISTLGVIVLILTARHLWKCI